MAFLSDTQVNNFLTLLRAEFTALKDLISPVTEASEYTVITASSRSDLETQVEAALAAGWKAHSFSSSLVEVAIPATIDDILNDVAGIVFYHQVMVK